MRPPRHFLQLSVTTLCLLVIKAAAQNPHNNQKSPKSSLSAIFVFGDSTVDPGNNNYVSETIFKSNFPPYGRDFYGHTPTGRFSNGRLVTDFAASYLGIKKYVPPYLDPTLSIEEMTTGVSFASAGSGLDPLTNKIDGSIPVQKQLEYLRECRGRLEAALGKERTQTLINKAAFIISAGTNDLIVNYFSAVPVRRLSYTVSGYQHFLVQNLLHLIQDLEDEGAQVIGIVGLPPAGCLPGVITLYSGNSLNGRGCVEWLSNVAEGYNYLLQDKLEALKNGGPLILYADIYTPLIKMIHGQEFGFDVVDAGCCGTGLLDASFLCNPKVPTCPDASKYVFWDSIHPTEKAYSTIFDFIRPIIDPFLTSHK